MMRQPVGEELVIERMRARAVGWWQMITAAFRYNAKDVLGPTDKVERLTGAVCEVAELGDGDVVQGWLRELGPHNDQQVLVHRNWGTVVAVADGSSPVSVFWTDGDKTWYWYAAPPGVVGERDLTSQQVERVLLEALTSPGPPSWPDWRVLI